MSRIVGVIGSVAINNTKSYEQVGLNNVYTQCVRWKRKPSWIPPAKGRLFKMPQRVKHPEGEAPEVFRLTNNYHTYEKSLRQYIAEYFKENQIQIDTEVLKKEEEEDFLVCSKINDEWNKEIAAQREIRLAKERKERREPILQNLIEIEQQEKELQEKLKEKIEKLNKEAPSFITEKNIDQAIEQALAKIVDHNAAIDVSGNFYPGSGPKVEKVNAKA